MTTQPQSRSDVEALRLADAMEAPALVAGAMRHEVITELRRLHDVEEAAKNLVKVKGRYHTEQAFNKLKELVK